MSTESVMQSNHLILYHPLLLLPSIFPNIRVSSQNLALCIQLPKSFSFSIHPSNEYSGLISFRIDWFDLLEFKEFSRVFSSTTNQKYQFFAFLYGPQHVILKGKLIPSLVIYLTKCKFLVKIFNTKILPSLEEEAEVEIQRNLQSLHWECLLLAVWTTPLAPFKSSWEMQGFRPHFRMCISESTF